MGLLLDRTVARIYSRTDFKRDDVEEIFKTQAALDFALAIASVEVEKKAAELGLDPLVATEAVEGLAEQFGEAFESPSPERTAKIKELVNTLIDDENPEFEALLEAYFGVKLDFEFGINNTVARIDELLSEPS